MFICQDKPNAENEEHRITLCPARAEYNLSVERLPAASTHAVSSRFFVAETRVVVRSLAPCRTSNGERKELWRRKRGAKEQARCSRERERERNDRRGDNDGRVVSIRGRGKPARRPRKTRAFSSLSLPPSPVYSSSFPYRSRQRHVEISVEAIARTVSGKMTLYPARIRDPTWIQTDFFFSYFGLSSSIRVYFFHGIMYIYIAAQIYNFAVSRHDYFVRVWQWETLQRAYGWCVYVIRKTDASPLNVRVGLNSGALERPV